MKPASYMIDHKLGKCPNFPSWQQTSARLFSNTGKLHLGMLTHWGRVTHICASKLIIISSDNGLSPDRHQAIICSNAGILSIGPLVTKPNEISITIHIFSFKKMHLKMSSGKWRPCCPSLNELILITKLGWSHKCLMFYDGDLYIVETASLHWDSPCFPRKEALYCCNSQLPVLTAQWQEVGASVLTSGR